MASVGLYYESGKLFKSIYLPCSNLGPDDCDFDDEAGWCIWHNVNQSWYLQSGNATSLNTGPESDNGGLKGGNCMHAHVLMHKACQYTSFDLISALLRLVGSVNKLSAGIYSII